MYSFTIGVKNTNNSGLPGVFIPTQWYAHLVSKYYSTHPRVYLLYFPSVFLFVLGEKQKSGQIKHKIEILVLLYIGFQVWVIITRMSIQLPYPLPLKTSRQTESLIINWSQIKCPVASGTTSPVCVQSISKRGKINKTSDFWRLLGCRDSSTIGIYCIFSVEKKKVSQGFPWSYSPGNWSFQVLTDVLC